MQQVKDKGIYVERVIRIFGERPSQEEIQKMWANRYKEKLIKEEKATLLKEINKSL
jgi:hypothetical protein